MFRWYVVNTYSGHENKVKHNLEHRVVSLGQQRARAPGRRADRGRLRDEGQPESHRREAHHARLRARQHGAQRGLLGRRQGHPRRHRLRRRLPGARPAHPGRGRPAPAQGGRHRRRAPAPSSRSARPSRSSPGRSPTSPARSPRSTTTPPSSRSWYQSSVARRRSRSTSTRSRSSRPPARKLNRHGKEGPHHDQAAGQRRAGEPRPAGRSRAGSARHQHHGVLQGLQRPDLQRNRDRHPRRDHRLRGPLLHVRHQDAARRRPDPPDAAPRQGLRRAPPQQGRQAHPRPARRDRRAQAPRPQRPRHRARRAHHRRHRALDGRRGRVA